VGSASEELAGVGVSLPDRAGSGGGAAAEQRDRWRAFALKPHQVETFKLSPDPRFIDKVRDIVGLYLNPPEGAVVLCVDEKSQIQALDRSASVPPLMPGVRARQTHDYGRNGTTNLYAALDVASGQVISEMTPRHRAEEFGRFLNLIDPSVPAHLDMHVVLDDFSTHKTPSIRRWLVVWHKTADESARDIRVHSVTGELSGERAERLYAAGYLDRAELGLGQGHGIFPPAVGLQDLLAVTRVETRDAVHPPSKRDPHFFELSFSSPSQGRSLTQPYSVGGGHRSTQSRRQISCENRAVGSKLTALPRLLGAHPLNSSPVWAPTRDGGPTPGETGRPWLTNLSSERRSEPSRV
jgi:hypothetical protein